MTQKRSDAAAFEPSTKTPFDVIKEAGATIGTNNKGAVEMVLALGESVWKKDPDAVFLLFCGCFELDGDILTSENFNFALGYALRYLTMTFGTQREKYPSSGAIQTNARELAGNAFIAGVFVYKNLKMTESRLSILMHIFSKREIYEHEPRSLFYAGQIAYRLERFDLCVRLLKKFLGKMKGLGRGEFPLSKASLESVDRMMKVSIGNLKNRGRRLSQGLNF